MRYTVVVPGVIGLLALAGCNASTKVTPKPGQWEWTSKGEIVEVKGVPDAIGKEMIARKPPATPPERKCLSAEDAAKDITQLSGINDGSCAFSDVKSGGGSFSGNAQCGKTGDMAVGKGSFTGTIAPETITMDLDMSMTMAIPVAITPGGATVRVKMTRTGKYVGECPAGAK